MQEEEEEEEEEEEDRYYNSTTRGVAVHGREGETRNGCAWVLWESVRVVER